MEIYSAVDITKQIGVAKPVLLIDEECIWLDEAKASSRCFLGDEYPFWKCHFIDNPVMPGTYMLEMMAQSAAVFDMLHSGCESVPIITSMTNIRFLKEISPGQEVQAEINLKQISGDYYTTKGKLVCKGKTVCKSEMVHYVKR